MSAQVDQFCENLRVRLNAIEERFQSARSYILELPAQSEKAVRQRVEEARGELQSRKSRVEQALAKVKAGAQQKLAETKEEVSQWKAQREVRKLNARADRAEA